MPPRPDTLDYHAPPARAATLAATLLPFAIAHASAGVLCEFASVLIVGDWNSYLGRDVALAVGAVASLLAAGVALPILAGVAAPLRQFTGRAPGWRSPHLRAAIGAGCALATFLPALIDTHLTGLLDVGSGNVIASGRGTTLGWLNLLTTPLLAALILLRRRDAGHR